MYGNQPMNVPLPSAQELAMMLSQLQSPMGMAAQTPQMMPLSPQEQAVLMSLTQGGKQPLPNEQVDPIMQALAMLFAQQQAGGQPGMQPGMPPMMPGMGGPPPGMMPPGMSMGGMAPPPPMM